ncbi:MAG: redoxin domain-containing protein [Alphaproteobacteria bacterium]|nr:redoxin domain-containing protein [Alphaproteobacteria bacterium]
MKEFTDLGYNVATVSYDKVPPLTSFAKRRNIGFKLLADSDAAIIKAFDVVNESFPKDAPWYGVAVPIIFVTNAEGVITQRFSEVPYSNRPKIDLVLNAIRK